MALLPKFPILLNLMAEAFMNFMEEPPALCILPKEEPADDPPFERIAFYLANDVTLPALSDDSLAF